MTDPLSVQRPLLVWHPDREEVSAARALLIKAGVRCSMPVVGDHYSVFCAYLSEPLSSELMNKVRALASVIQVSLKQQ